MRALFRPFGFSCSDTATKRNHAELADNAPLHQLGTNAGSRFFALGPNDQNMSEQSAEDRHVGLVISREFFGSPRASTSSGRRTEASPPTTDVAPAGHGSGLAPGEPDRAGGHQTARHRSSRISFVHDMNLFQVTRDYFQSADILHFKQPRFFKRPRIFQAAEIFKETNLATLDFQLVTTQVRIEALWIFKHFWFFKQLWIFKHFVIPSHEPLHRFVVSKSRSKETRGCGGWDLQLGGRRHWVHHVVGLLLLLLLLSRSGSPTGGHV